MRMFTFAKRCTKEILRDPINLGFGLGFPLALLLLLSAIQANIPVNLFEIDTLTPGITVFGLSFMTLFSATLIAKDRESAFLQRLYTTPLTGFDFIMGYMLPINVGLKKSVWEHSLFLWRRQWQPTPVLLPGKSHGRRTLMGRSPWGR